jgi:hypothetical protein
MTPPERILDCINRLENCKVMPVQKATTEDYVVPRDLVELVLDLLYNATGPLTNRHR